MLKMEGYKIERTVWKNCLEKNINSEKVLILKENYRYNSFVTSTKKCKFCRKLQNDENYIKSALNTLFQEIEVTYFFCLEYSKILLHH